MIDLFSEMRSLWGENPDVFNLFQELIISKTCIEISVIIFNCFKN